MTRSSNMFDNEAVGYRSSSMTPLNCAAGDAAGYNVLANVYNWGMNIVMRIAGNRLTQGLCGSHDSNTANDLTVQGTGQIIAPTGSKRLAPQAVVNSWRYVMQCDTAVCNQCF